MNPLTDWMENQFLRVGVSRAGAEMISLQAKRADGTWAGFLYRDGEMEPPAEGWGNHATVMGYFLHRLLGERSPYRQWVIHGGNHGFIRHLNFQAPEKSEDKLTYTVRPEMIPREAYPLRVSLQLSYILREDALEVEFHFLNEEATETAHLSFGLHPGFAVRSPLTCGIEFPEGKLIRHLAPGNFLNGETESIDFPGGSMPFPREKLPDSFLIELSQVPRTVFKISDADRVVELDFHQAPYATIWSDLGSFLCIEPCWGLPDNNPQKPFEQKTGIQSIPPGARLRTGFQIKPHFAQ